MQGTVRRERQIRSLPLKSIGNTWPNGIWNTWDSCIDEDKQGLVQEPREEMSEDGGGLWSLLERVLLCLVSR